MIRLSRLADYGVVLMTHIAMSHEPLHTATAAAQATRVPEPTVGKILKALSRQGLLDSHRGSNGGYSLARAPQDIRVTEIITAVDGPIARTSCLDSESGACDMETFCPTRTNWQKINEAVSRALDGISLADMMGPFAAFTMQPSQAGARDGERET
jgi:FeS assembly SUF system regulator